MEIAGTVALVTGAGSGIGYETALALVQAGSRVIATDFDHRGLEGLSEAAGLAGRDLQVELLDVSDAGAWAALAQRLAQQGVTPSIVVNNAGIGFWGPFVETPIAAWDRLIAVNLMGVVHGCRTFAAAMVASGKPACLVNVSSGVSAGPMPNLSAYCATKWAVEGLTDVLAMEFAETKVRAISIHPGIVDTDIVHNDRASAPSVTPEQTAILQAYYSRKGCHARVVAQRIVRAIERGTPKLFVGPLAALSAWMRRLAPTGLRRRLTIRTARNVGYCWGR
jgi:NAD(P)-dependent dehydrogenase (short-subunit alcohol dehydrogenase family)